MKKLSLLIVLIGMIGAVYAQSYKADATQTKIKWLGKKVTGEHVGFINLKEGNLEVSNGAVTGGQFVIDMTSITNTDIESAEYNQKLVGHLKSDDFFGVEKFPTSTFTIKSVKAVSNGDMTHEFTGDITIKGKTMEIVVPAKVDMSGDQIKAVASFVIDRSKFDVKYGSGSFFEGLGDNLIYDDFTMDVDLVASK